VARGVLRQRELEVGGQGRFDEQAQGHGTGKADDNPQCAAWRHRHRRATMARPATVPGVPQ
jgi:hypothetical protein